MDQSEERQSEKTPPPQRHHCPTCRRHFTRPAAADRKQPKSFPFCSERCKLIDLGAWLDAEYRIASRPEDAPEDALPDGFNDPQESP
jgi:endogenous inhibitor of DNA gyrase (YacG/DUF329 family)